MLITTKNGRSATARGPEIVVSQDVTFDDELRLPDYQDAFGQGSRGRFEYFDGYGNGVNDGTDESWGPPLDQGLMIPQYVAASLVSENKVLAHPASVDSIPSSANQEDHVSMGTTAARKLRQILDNTFTVLAIEYLCAAQAIEFGSGRLGAGTQAAYDLLRTRVAPLDEDRELDGDIAAARDLITSGALVRRVAEALAHAQSGNPVVEPF